MWYIFVLLVASFVITFFFTPVTKILAEKYGAIDIPDGERKQHKNPTPRLGGLGIVLSFTIVCFVGTLIFQGSISNNVLIICICAMLICLIGVMDDIYSLPAWVKFIAELLIATIATIWGGAIEYVIIFGNVWHFGVFSIPLTILWYTLLMNAINLIDGLDGLACGVTSIMSITIFVISILKGSVESAIVAAALLGATIGFLPFNIGKNTVFMGDCGSLTFGFILAAISTLDMLKSATLISSVTPAIIFALPLFDLISVFFQRTINGQNPFKADRRHIHFKFIEIGISKTVTVIIIMVATAIYCAGAIISIYDKLIAVIVTIVLSIVLVLLKHAKDWFGITVENNE